MNNEKKNILTVSWLSGLLSAEIFISTGEWGVQMPPLTSENSHFLRSGPQEATLIMTLHAYWYHSVPLEHWHTGAESRYSPEYVDFAWPGRTRLKDNPARNPAKSLPISPPSNLANNIYINMAANVCSDNRQTSV